MKRLFKEFDEDDKYWTTSSEWRDYFNKNKPQIKEITPIKPQELVYIKMIQSRVEDGVPLTTMYIRRDGTNVNDKKYADLFTLKSAEAWLQRHPDAISQDKKFKFHYEIESLRLY